MTAIWFDHLFTFTSATSIDAYLSEYLAQGFLTHEQTVRHPPGLRNGFVSLGPDYLEFWSYVTVEHLGDTARVGTEFLQAFVAASQP